MKHWLLWALLIILAFPGFSQIDSLKKALDRSEGKEQLTILDALAQATVKTQDGLSWADKLKAAAIDQGDSYYIALSHHYRGSAFESEGNIPISILEHLEGIKLFTQISRLDKVARQHVNIGNRYADIGLYDSALSSYGRGEELAKLANDTMALYGSIVNISTIHHDRGDKEKELEYLMKAQDLVAGIGDPDQLALMKYNIAVFYAEDGQRKKAHDLIKESYATYQKTNNAFGMGSVHTLWAEFHFKDGKQDSALLELDKAIELYEKSGDVNRVALILMNQGAVLSTFGRSEEGIRKIDMAYDIFKEIGDKRFVGKTLIAKAEHQRAKKDFTGAIKLAEEAVAIGEEIWVRADLINWTRLLADLYVENKQYEKGFNALERHSALKDSINEENKSEAIAKMEAQFQTERKQLEIESLKSEKAFQDIELEHEENKRLGLTIGLILTLLMVVVIGFALVQKKKDNRLISAQKTEVEFQNKEIELQRIVLEEKNREITDSITYAKRIQEAILPEEEFWSTHLPDSFVLYKPKDIVAGDFYWMEKRDNLVLFAAADCTGHGAPGAMVSVVCHNALNRAVREYGLIRPAEILNKVRELVVETFESQLDQTSDTIKDGMDIALCSMDLNAKTVSYAGAHNPLWLISKHDHDLAMRTEKDDLKLYEIKADKQPIGSFEAARPFADHTIKLNSGATIYVFSDGYSDQFGGDRGKKFKQASMRDLILNIQGTSLDEQKSTLGNTIDSWRGELEQIDDICIIGIRV